MGLTITFNNLSDQSFKLKTFQKDLAKGVSLDKSLPFVLVPEGMESLIIRDQSMMLLASGSASVTIIWETNSRIAFGIKATYAGSLEGVHMGSNSWGYMTKTPSEGNVDNWINQSDLSAAVQERDVNDQFSYSIVPKILSEEMSFNVTIGSKA